MVANNLDGALVAVYQEFDVPVDGYFGDRGLTQAFVTAVGNHMGERDLDPQEVMRRLMNLRKKGQLPRLRRAYFGRTLSNG